VSAPGERFSPHFTYDEMTATSVRGFDNTPGPTELRNLRRTCAVLERVRLEFGPWHITSGFRSEFVNRVIGGSPKSRHMDGLAADGIPLKKVSWRDVVEFIRTLPDVDQVIYEFGRWIHIGLALEGAEPRQQALMTFNLGKFEPWNGSDPRVKR
jgi:zinc D-Ala-D-Ala carboxypeptidase